MTPDEAALAFLVGLWLLLFRAPLEAGLLEAGFRLEESLGAETLLTEVRESQPRIDEDD